MRFLLAGAALGASFQCASALRVAPGSQCSVQCGNVLDSTSDNDIVCKDADYTAVSAGQVFQKCISCESTSDYVSSTSVPQQTDLGSMLYNMRYAMDYCIFDDRGNKDIGSCLTSRACGPLQQALEIDRLSPNASTFSYCSLWNFDFSEQCSNCLNFLETGGHILNNYLRVLEGACRISPKPGLTLGLDGDIFSLTNPVNVSTPTPTAEFKSHGPAGPLSLGAIVGVVIGGVVAILAFMGCCVVWNGKRRRKAFLRKREEMQKTWPSPAPGSEMFQTPVNQQQPLRNWGDTPLSQRPLRGWDESPITPVTEHTYPGRYVSPYGSQFTSPVSAAHTPGPNSGWPAEKAAQNIGVAISPDSEHGHNAFWGDKKGKDREQHQQQQQQQQHHYHHGNENEDAYEMQEGVGSAGGHSQHQVLQYQHQVAPFLEHPGYGRRGPTTS
ncbi:Centromere/microtubule-binding protein cbf5 [Apiospora hydei]|uniref:Centromere/microtubule-binding protein cbf5 n=1 Tax=Apiospora hydei TaxID=1337664 RepID=A0ABR1UWD2_9PEZI